MHLWRFYVESKLCDSYLRKWRIQSEFDLSGLLKALFKVLINTQSNIRSLCFVFFFFLFVFCKNPNKEPNRNTMCFMNAQRKQGLKRKQLDFFFFLHYINLYLDTHTALTETQTNHPSTGGGFHLYYSSTWLCARYRQRLTFFRFRNAFVHACSRFRDIFYWICTRNSLEIGYRFVTKLHGVISGQVYY